MTYIRRVLRVFYRGVCGSSAFVLEPSGKFGTRSNQIRYRVCFSGGHLFLAACCLCMSLGCRVAPATNSGFIERPEDMTYRRDLPFDVVWIQPGLDWTIYDKIFIRGVDTTHLARMEWWKDATFAKVGDRMSHIRLLADYLKQSFLTRFSEDPRGRFEVVTTIDHGTLVLEMALIEIVPTSVWSDEVGIAIVGAAGEGTAAFEARLRDSRGNVVAKFKDREQGSVPVTRAADLTWYSHAHGMMDRWAEGTVNLMTEN